MSRKRSVAWIYYTIIAVALAVASIAGGQPTGLLLALLPAAYAFYLFRGGSIVVWFW